MGPLTGAVHWIKHRAEPLVITKGFKNQKTPVEDDLECPGIEAGQGESHGRNAHHFLQPEPSWGTKRKCLELTTLIQQKRSTTLPALRWFLGC